MTKTFLKISLTILLSILFASCDDTLTVEDVDNRTIPDSNVSYSQHISPIFELKCVRCHGNGRLEADLNLTHPSYFVDGHIVVPGESGNSVLIWRIDPQYALGIMPPPPNIPLTPNQIQGVKTWIDEGAKSN